MQYEGTVPMSTEPTQLASLELADGNRIPVLGLGVWQVTEPSECVEAVRWALELGYRHIDTAQVYGNEESVGRGLREAGLAREDVFVTTKFYPSRDDPVAELEASLGRLGLESVDLYLVHWPVGGATRPWRGMERALQRGLTRSIGVSNYSVAELTELRSFAEAQPVVNQAEFNPQFYRRALLEHCRGERIVLEGYSPLGTGELLSDATVAAVAGRVGRTPAQVLLRWRLEREVPVIPKSTHRERIEENAQIFDFSLSEADLAELDGLDRTGGGRLRRPRTPRTSDASRRRAPAGSRPAGVRHMT